MAIVTGLRGTSTVVVVVAAVVVAVVVVVAGAVVVVTVVVGGLGSAGDLPATRPKIAPVITRSTKPMIVEVLRNARTAPKMRLNIVISPLFLILYF